MPPRLTQRSSKYSAQLIFSNKLPPSHRCSSYEGSSRQSSKISRFELVSKLSVIVPATVPMNHIPHWVSPRVLTWSFLHAQGTSRPNSIPTAQHHQIHSRDALALAMTQSPTTARATTTWFQSQAPLLACATVSATKTLRLRDQSPSHHLLDPVPRS